MKRVGVLFSGGLDSTYLLYKNLKEGNIVVPIYIEIKNNVKKSKLEKNRVELLYNEFKSEFGNYIKEIQYIINIDLYSSEHNLSFAQMPVWIVGLIYSQCLCVDEFQIGYCIGDDAISYIDDIKDIYYSFNKINNDSLKPIAFPIIKNSKIQTFCELPQQYKDLIVSCEKPTLLNDDSQKIEYKPCCECAVCKRIIASNYYGTYSFPDYYKTEIHKKLIRDLYHNYKCNVFDFENNNLTEREFFAKLSLNPSYIQLKLNF